MELQGVSSPGRTPIVARPRSARVARSLAAAPVVVVVVAAAVLALTVLALAPPAADALPVAFGAPPGPAKLVASQTKPPAGDHLLAPHVYRIAARNPEVRSELRKHGHLVAYEYTRGVGTWQVSWFTPPRPHTAQKEMIQVYINDATGQVTQIWTGYQIAWTMARGYPGAFGRKANSLIVWIPLSVLFVAPFLPLPWPARRRRRRSGSAHGRSAAADARPARRPRPTLLHLDLLMLLGFSISLAWFNNANLGLSVPAVYPFMLYLMARMLLLAFGRGRPREPLRTLVPASWLAIGLVFLIGFRIALNVTNSNVIDVGYAGVIGANKALHGDKLYGNWPSDNPSGDTYGPINYDAYVPFKVLFGWSGVWDDLPAAHAAAIAFDLLTMLGLFLLGRLIRGPTLGVILAYMWAAYPFTLFALCSNSNDALVALMLVITLLAIRWAPVRGVASAFAGLTKFAPLLLAPLFLRGTGPEPNRRQVLLFAGGFVAALLLAMAPVLVNDNLGAFWRDTISYQVGRPAPFSIWGLWGGSFTNGSNSLRIEQHLAEGAVLAMAGGAMFVPRKRGLVEVAALGGALLIAFQMCLTYWFYLYIVWFFPLVIIALAGSHPGAKGIDERSPPAGHRYLPMSARASPARV